jgi:UDP-N-acetylmuramoyl-tripeptide--D-alanyl-D-alanine ligase
MRLTADWVAAQMGGAVTAGDAAREFGDVSIDTRTLKAGDLYVGIRGERFDGAAFAAAAIDAGAVGVVVPRGAPAPAEHGAVVIEVDDTTEALQALAHGIRRASGTKVVAITGSAGKTTTKDVTSDFLEARYRVVRNRGNFNNHIGLPLSLIELRRRPEMAVVELGMNHAGEISTLVRVAEPDVRVWTNVGEAHLGFFASLDAIADAKAEILEGAVASTLLVANADDPRIVARAKSFAGRVVTFGIDQPADVQATGVADRGLDGIAAHVRTPVGEVDLQTPLLGRGNLANVLAATAVALEFDVPLDAVAARAARLHPAHHRGELLRLAGGLTLIDDSYNSSPSALKRALDTIKVATGSARKVAVLGEMLELGAHASRLHQECGAAAAAADLTLLIAVGGAPAQLLAEQAIRSGMPLSAVVYVPTSAEAADVAAERTRPGDLVLVKGSRGIGTDAVVERLKAEYA